MKRIKMLLIMAAVIISVMPVRSYASDYQGGKEKEDSIFQKLGDLITGKYEVKGEPIKKTGVIQVMADQVQDVKAAAVR